MQRSKNDLWVGLFVMLGAVALVFLALQSANLLSLNFQSGYRITARFDNIGGGQPPAAGGRRTPLWGSRCLRRPSLPWCSKASLDSFSTAKPKTAVSPQGQVTR